MISCGGWMETKTLLSLEAERLQVIADRRLALQHFALAGEERRKMIHTEYIAPLNERLCTLNRRLGK